MYMTLLTVSLTFPQSTTNTTSSIVILVSAILVAMTIFLTPGGGLSNTYKVNKLPKAKNHTHALQTPTKKIENHTTTYTCIVAFQIPTQMNHNKPKNTFKP